jgi:hypothetical protein
MKYSRVGRLVFLVAFILLITIAVKLRSKYILNISVIRFIL